MRMVVGTTGFTAPQNQRIADACKAHRDRAGAEHVGRGELAITLAERADLALRPWTASRARSSQCRRPRRRRQPVPEGASISWTVVRSRISTS